MGSGALAGAVLSSPVLGVANSPMGRSSSSSLSLGFVDPPLRARPRAYWVWSNGNFDLEQLTRELEDVKAKGLGGLDIFDIGVPDERNVIPAGPEFMSDEAMEGYVHAVREGTRLDLEIGFITSSSWNAGGPWVTPRLASKTIYATETRVGGPGPVDLALPYPEVPEPKFSGREGGEDPWAGQEIYSKQIAVLAVPTRADRVVADIADIIDLTDRVDETPPGEGARLTWKAPEGEWTVLRIISTNNRERLVLPSPRSDGYMIDHLSAEATEAHLKVIIDGLQEGLGTFEDTALGFLYLPSYEVRGLREWTPTFAEEFRRRRGYNIRPYLTVLFDWTIESPEISERFHFDRRLTTSDLLIENHYRKATEVCREHGLGLHAESGGPGQPIHDFPAEALSALNAVGVPRGEFWVRRPPDEDDHANVVAAVASAIHIYGEQVGEMESFTSMDHWEKGPFDLKPYADRVLAQGANRFVFHTMPHNPPAAGRPGWAYHAGTHVGPNRVWWPKAEPFVAYLARSSYLLQEGRFIADVCFYHGHDAPMTIDEKPFDPNAETLGFGYDYDYVNTDVLLNHMSVQEGRIVLSSGMRYAVLVLPDREDMPIEVLEKIELMIREGATAIGPKPIRTPGLNGADESTYAERDERLRRLADRLWGDVDGDEVAERTYGEGKIVWGRPIRDVLEAEGVAPDFTFAGGDDETELDFVHRTTDQHDIYFIANLKNRWEWVDCQFRVAGTTPEIWIPETGERIRHVLYDSEESRTTVGLELPPFGSAFVVFGESDSEMNLVAASRDGQSLFPAPQGPAPGRRPIEVRFDEQDGLEIIAWEPGTYAFRAADGSQRQIEVPHLRRPISLNGAWVVRFPEGLGAPPAARFENLVSWTEHPDAGIRHFSGMATYERSFDVAEGSLNEHTRILLDLGSLQHVGEVVINGRSLGILWKPPYTVDATDAIVGGRNHLRVEVANVWANRLLGDRGKPASERFTTTNVAESRQRDELVPSGLFGPVQVRFGIRRFI